MNVNLNSNVQMYNDFSGLARLRADAARNEAAAGMEAAKQFEALFVQMMLKSMRAANSVFGEERDTTYEEMFDRQIAVELTRDRGIGLAQLMTQQLSLTGGDDGNEYQLDAPQTLTFSQAPRQSARADWRPGSPAEFLHDIWPFAARAAERLGTEPEPIAAQAALETGWGQKLIRDAAGISGNNLFGIKAGRGWDGERMTITTLEYDQGVAAKQRAQFRAYPDLATAFDDYVSFLNTNPRYSEVTAGGLSPSSYVKSLQTAGYATDPEYAEKIQRIMGSSEFLQTTDRLRASTLEPRKL